MAGRNTRIASHKELTEGGGEVEGNVAGVPLLVDTVHIGVVKDQVEMRFVHEVMLQSNGLGRYRTRIINGVISVAEWIVFRAGETRQQNDEKPVHANSNYLNL